MVKNCNEFFFRLITFGILSVLIGLPPLLQPGIIIGAEKNKGNIDSEIAATIQGKPIYLSDLNSPEIYKLRRDAFRLEEELLRKMVVQGLRRDKPKEFKQPKIIISSDELENFFKKAGLSSKGSLENYAKRIRGYLTKIKSREIEDNQYKKGVKKGYVKTFRKPPVAFLFKIKSVKRKADMGPENAPVQIIEFSDFQCPYCRRAFPTIQKLMKNHPGKIHFVYRHLPLDNIHSEARGAAEASECAADQGKFWPFHDLLFLNQKRQKPKHLEEYAEKSQLKMDSFRKCVTEKRYAGRVQEDINVADSLNITGTPGFLVGRKVKNGMIEGEIISGAQPLNSFEIVIKQYLPAK